MYPVMYCRSYDPSQYAPGNNTGTIAAAGTNYSTHCHAGWPHLCQSMSQTIRLAGSQHCSTGTIDGPLTTTAAAYQNPS